MKILKTGFYLLLSTAVLTFAEEEGKQRRKIELSDLPPIPSAPRKPIDQSAGINVFLKTQPELLAKYGDWELKLSEMRNSYIRSLQMQGRALSPVQIRSIFIQQVKAAVERSILSVKASEAGLSTSPETLDEELRKMAIRYGGLQMLLQRVKMQGVDPEDFKRDFASNLAIRKYLDLERGKMKIEDSRIEVFYNNNREKFTLPEDQIRVSHILISVNATMKPAQKAEAKKKLEGVLAQVRQGVAFAGLARKVSDCPSGKRSGGDLNYFSRKSRMDETFSKAAWVMKPGEISEVIETRFGYHIIKVTDLKKAGLIPLADVKENIIKEMQQQELKKHVSEIIATERKSGKLQLFFK